MPASPSIENRLLDPETLREYLDEKYDRYNRADFIESDPISVPHRYTSAADIEIAGFLAATIAWGQRATIVRNANKLADLMGDSPADFIRSHKPRHRVAFHGFVHRTFNGVDCCYFLEALQHIYKVYGSLEAAFTNGNGSHDGGTAIEQFRQAFFSLPHPERTRKHVSDPGKNSSAKRLNMYLRWMVRFDNRGVDFGIWKSMKPAALYMPLDVHTGNVGRQLGLLSRTQNDWKAVNELTVNLRKLDLSDPVKYDFALFGLGVFEHF